MIKPKILSYGQWKTAVDKWKGIIEDIETHDEGYRPSIMGTCGFCLRFYNKRADYYSSNCAECSLFKDEYCSNTYDGKVLFWKIRNNGKANALKLSKQMLKRIRAEPHKPKIKKTKKKASSLGGE
jgi:hypothetical protein